jgi:hypothetical protein
MFSVAQKTLKSSCSASATIARIVARLTGTGTSWCAASCATSFNSSSGAKIIASPPCCPFLQGMGAGFHRRELGGEVAVVPIGGLVDTFEIAAPCPAPDAFIQVRPHACTRVTRGCGSGLGSAALEHPEEPTTDRAESSCSDEVLPYCRCC